MSDLHGQKDAKANLTDCIESVTSYMDTVAPVLLAPVTPCNISLRVYFISFSEKLKRGPGVHCQCFKINLLQHYSWNIRWFPGNLTVSTRHLEVTADTVTALNSM